MESWTKYVLTVTIRLKDVVTPYTHISEASRYILYTIILTLDGICTISWSWVKMWSLNDMARFSTAQRKTARSEMTQYRDVLTGRREKSHRSWRRFLFKQTQSQLSLGSQEWWVRFSHTRLTVTVTTVTVSVSRESETWSESETERHAQSQSQRQSQLVACFYTVIYQSVFPTRTTSTPAATSSPSSRLAAYGMVWPYLTEKCAALDITIARFHCMQRVPNKRSPWWYVIITSKQANVQGGIWKGYCHATRHSALVKVASQAQ